LIPLRRSRPNRRGCLTLTENDFQETFQKWRRRWDRCLHAGGSYFVGDGGRLALLWVLWLLRQSGIFWTPPRTLVINTGINLLQMNEMCVNDILTNQLHYRGPVSAADNESTHKRIPCCYVG
jgi:hypothetical protein